MNLVTRRSYAAFLQTDQSLLQNKKSNKTLTISIIQFCDVTVM